MNKKVIAGRVVSGIIFLLFMFNVVTKIFWTKMYPQMPEGLAQIGLPMEILPILAALEFMCAVLYIIPQTAVLGAVLFTGYFGGAILTHLRVGQPVYIQILFGLIVWLGVYIREPRLHALLPIRKK